MRVPPTSNRTSPRSWIVIGRLSSCVLANSPTTAQLVVETIVDPLGDLMRSCPMPLGAGVEFLDAPLAAFGVLLVLGALVSGLADRSFLSLTAGFVLAGLVLGEAGFGALDFDPTSEFVQGLAVVALILILFRDGLEVEEEALRRGLAPAAPQPRAGDAAHRRARRRCHSHPHRPRLDRVLPPRRAPLAHRPGAELRGRHEPPRAAHHPALAQPGVRPERRPGAAGGARVHRRGGGQRRLRLVAVRAPGRAGRASPRASWSRSWPRA